MLWQSIAAPEDVSPYSRKRSTLQAILGLVKRALASTVNTVPELLLHSWEWMPLMGNPFCSCAETNANINGSTTAKVGFLIHVLVYFMGSLAWHVFAVSESGLGCWALQWIKMSLRIATLTSRKFWIIETIILSPSFQCKRMCLPQSLISTLMNISSLFTQIFVWSERRQLDSVEDSNSSSSLLRLDLPENCVSYVDVFCFLDADLFFVVLY